MFENLCIGSKFEDSIKKRKRVTEDVFNDREKESNHVKWIGDFLPQFTTEIPRDPLDKDEDVNLRPIKNDKMPMS